MNDLSQVSCADEEAASKGKSRVSKLFAELDKFAPGLLKLNLSEQRKAVELPLVVHVVLCCSIALVFVVFVLKYVCRCWI